MDFSCWRTIQSSKRRLAKWRPGCDGCQRRARVVVLSLCADVLLLFAVQADAVPAGIRHVSTSRVEYLCLQIDRWNGVLLLVRKDCANVKFTTCFDKTHPFTENTLSFPVQIENLTLAKSSCVRVKVLRSSDQSHSDCPGGRVPFSGHKRSQILGRVLEGHKFLPEV